MVTSSCGLQVFKWVERKDTGRKAQALQQWKYFVDKQRMSDRAAVEIGMHNLISPEKVYIRLLYR